jgi:DNA-binding response OmpR family regulator
MPCRDILIVDDDTATADVLADVLAIEGYQVRVARNGSEGLALLDDGYPDMLVLDVEMPGVSGPEMALQMFLKDFGREKIPILLCSGIFNLRNVAAQVGTPYYLAKPYTLRALLELVERVLVERTPPTHHSSRTG